ncbi:methyltransferase domain protein [Asticcacaulis biprosthecium C19]|uniref:Methyltransferase domain protein n=1 Tax=Asticcacaulis biprosthecium C19 TaxID=715226 RepID=F4QPL9_9CAUL|nr:class I SAM-dependent methyltransferase [Asticcacaulis biprosthecium]EGF91277.1 methyltransferase domain protein [Asticcacaulis biprosthecium C19]
MSDDTWTGGYVVDVEYTHGFYPELAPLNLAMAATLAGRRAVDVDQAYTYLELGCGNGYSTALLAAANPHGQFWGNDFNPTHILNARATAQAAGLENVTFLEASFEDLLSTELPEFDIITLHGIWSWVSAENRHYIVELIRRRLKPGGLVYVSYNCLPGWSRVAPLRRLMKLGVTNAAAPAPARVEQALTYARAMSEAGAGFFAATPETGALLDRLAKENPTYLAHEYLNEQWSLFYQDEVADALSPAKLGYVAQARLMEGFDQFNFKPAQRALLTAPDAPAASEVVRDFLLDRRFRRDVYSRGAPAITPDEVSQWLCGRRFALARLRSLCPLKLKRPGGEFNLTPQVFNGVLDGLVAGPATVEQLCEMPDLKGNEARHIEQALGVLCALDYVQPALAAEGQTARKAVTDRFNAAGLRSAAAGKPVAALASPVTGTGIPLPGPEQAFLAAIVRGHSPEAVADAMTPESEDQRNALRKRAQTFAREGLSVLKALQVI